MQYHACVQHEAKLTYHKAWVNNHIVYSVKRHYMYVETSSQSRQK